MVRSSPSSSRFWTILALNLIATAAFARSDGPIAVKTVPRISPVSYGREITDIFDGKCTGCHGPTVAQGKLRLDSVPGMLKGGKRGPALVAGKAEESLLFRMAAHRVEPFMPPKDKPDQSPLTPDELGTLKAWIDSGAKDDSAEVASRPIVLGSLPTGVHPINAVDMTSDGKLVASGRGAVVEVHDVDSGLLVTTLGGQKDLVQSLRFRPDGLGLAAGSFQVVTRWTLPKTGEAKTLTGHQEAVGSLAATPDGRWLVSAGKDRQIRIWDVEKGTLARNIEGPPGGVAALATSPDAKFLAAGGFDGSVHLFRLADGIESLAMKGHEGPVSGVAFVNRGKGLATAGFDGTAKIWPLSDPPRNGPREPLILHGYTGPIVALAASADGMTLATGGVDGMVRLWHAEDGRARAVIAMNEPVRGLALNPDGRSIAVGSDQGVVELFDADGILRGRLPGLKSRISALAFNPKGDRIAATTTGGGVKVWNVATKGGVAAFGHLGSDRNAPPPPLHAVSFLSDGSLATGSEAKTIKVWACEGDWVERPPLGPHAFRVLALDYSPDGKLIAAGGGEPSRSGEVKIWDGATGGLVRSLPDNLHSDTVFGVAFSPDGKSLATCAADRFLKVSNVADGKEVRSFEGHTGHVLSVAWKPDGKTLATGGADNMVKIWDFEAGDQVRTLEAAGKQVTAVRWSRDPGATVVAGASGDKLVRFWNPGNGGVRRGFPGANDYLFGVAISKDIARVVAGGADGTLYLWNGANGQLIRRFDR